MLVSKSDGVEVTQLTSSLTPREICKEILRVDAPTNNFSVLNITKIKDALDLWYTHLPTVRPFYAVKCNPDPEIIREIGKLGLGFDCASRSEIKKAIHLGINPAEDIIFAQTVKRRVDLEAISLAGVKYTTFDSAEELQKISNYGLDLDMLLRIKIETPSSMYPFNSRFGAEPQEYPELFKTARRLGVRIVGVCFHIGSGVSEFEDYYRAVEKAKKVFEQGENAGFYMRLLDIGGGFTQNSIEEAAFHINRGLTEFFQTSDVKVIAEPGRFFVSTIQAYAVCVTGKRVRRNEGERRIEYTLSDGSYGMFAAFPAFGILPIPESLKTPKSSEKFQTIFYGPTCSGYDILSKTTFEELETEDWLVFDNLGAYTNPLCTDFNGFEAKDQQKYYIFAEPTN